MAVVSNVLIGKASGSVGNATFSTWKGINVLKEKAVSVANPRSDKQLMQRSALSQVVAIFRLIPAILNLGFKKLAIKQSAYNAFESNALKNAFDLSAPPVATFVPANMLISKGSIAPSDITVSTRSLAAGFFTAEYDNILTGPGQSLTDSALAVAFNSTLNTWSASAAVRTRDDGDIEIPIPAGSVIGNTVFIYLGFFSSIDGTASDSANTTGLVVA